jgi:hypothetical protein
MQEKGIKLPRSNKKIMVKNKKLNTEEMRCVAT